MRRFIGAKRGQVLILMAVVLVAILGLTFLASVRTFKPTPKDPATAMAVLEAEADRAVFNAFAYASQREDSTLFRSSLLTEARNIALAHYGASVAIVNLQPPAFSWDDDNVGESKVSVNVSIAYAAYNLSWVNRYNHALRIQILELTREDLGAFTKLKFTVNFTLNSKPALFNGANVTVGGENYECQLTKNFGDGRLQLEATVLFSSSISGSLAIEDASRVLVKCDFAA